jgi:hypothetical protein
MKMIAQAGDVVGVGMAQQEAVDIKSTRVVAFEPPSQIFGDIGHFVVFVVRVSADINVDQQVLAVIETYESHVAVRNGKEGNGSSHVIRPCSGFVPDGVDSRLLKGRDPIYGCGYQ